MIVDQAVYENLEHYGTKGMRWGVRKESRVYRQQRRGAKLQKRSIDPLRRVAKGEGGKRDKVRAALTISGVDLVKGKGIQGGAKRSLERSQKLQTSIKAGEKRALDLLVRSGGINIRDLNYALDQ